MTSSDPSPDPGAPDDSVLTIDDATFLDSTVDAVSIVDFWAPWCGPCRQFAPVFEAAARRYGDRLRFARCNVDENPRTAGLLQIMSIPTIVIFDHPGNEVGRVVGAVAPAAFDRVLDELLQLIDQHS